MLTAPAPTAADKIIEESFEEGDGGDDSRIVDDGAKYFSDQKYWWYASCFVSPLIIMPLEKCQIQDIYCKPPIYLIYIILCTYLYVIKMILNIECIYYELSLMHR